MTSKLRGRFITLEGLDGTGKTTHIGLLENFLKDQGIDSIRTREPGGTPLGEAIRKLLLEDSVYCDNDTELLLLFSARAQHLQSVIYPALEAGRWVLCDRFTDATFAYQGGGRGVPFRRIEQLEEFVQQGLQPDLTLLLDLPLEQGLARATERGRLTDRFERLDLGFRKRVRQAYMNRQQESGNRFRLIDATGSVKQVQAAIQDQVKLFISLDPHK